MRKIILVIAFFYSFSIFSQNQNIIVDYSFYESYDSSSALPLNSVLKNNGKISLFEINDKINKEDKTNTTYDNNGNTVLNIQKKKNENRLVHKDFTTNELMILTDGYSSNNYFIINENFPDFNWKIENETKEILGYQCKNATTTFRGRNYTAWFTPKIPISDGPWKFGGLPGIILEIADDSGKIKIEANKLVLNAENIDTSFKINEKYPTVTWEEYIKNVDKEFSNQIKSFKSKASELGAEIELDLKFENMEYINKKDESN